MAICTRIILFFPVKYLDFLVGHMEYVQTGSGVNPTSSPVDNGALEGFRVAGT
jgi:hypothetical protein